MGSKHNPSRASILLPKSSDLGALGSSFTIGNLGDDNPLNRTFGGRFNVFCLDRIFKCTDPAIESVSWRAIGCDNTRNSLEPVSIGS
jgi:hypothetical protein